MAAGAAGARARTLPGRSADRHSPVDLDSPVVLASRADLSSMGSATGAGSVACADRGHVEATSAPQR
jgi:hypothetical protein